MVSRPRRPTGRRHRSRELALRVLFELEGTAKDPSEVLAYHAVELGCTGAVTGFADRLVTVCLQQSERIDAAIADASTHWRLADIGKVERAVLRLSTVEILLLPDIPVAVSIDEAVELARTYAGDDAAAFVNGVLGRIAAEAR